MTLLRLDHLSDGIKMTVPLNIILPDPAELKKTALQERTVLYLLHGLSDDASAWQRFSSIEIYARKYGLVVVMPSVGRSFYTDQANGQRYFSYIVEELPEYMQVVFAIQPRREKTLIAGLSMGGYGAFKAAFLHPEKYFAAGSFSGPLMLNMLSLIPIEDPIRNEFTNLFGDLEKISGSEHDPMAWLEKVKENLETLPRLYQSCGNEDDLYPANVLFRDACKKHGIPVNYREGKGKHDWYYWDEQIKEFLAVMLDSQDVSEENYE